jgi:hypothetical protein
MIYLFINLYEDKNPDRHKELVKCFQLQKVNPFLKVTPLGERPTFNDFFRIANAVAPNGSVVAISNSDIFFDETIQLAQNIKQNEVYALSRWDIQKDGSSKLFKRWDSQDTWIFRTPIKEIQGADFTMGVAGCDNVIAHLLEQSGYVVTNPSKTIHCHHLHLSNVRNYIQGSNVQRLPPPYKLVTPGEL